MPNVKIRIERSETETGTPVTKKTDDKAKDVAMTSIFANQMIGVAKQIISYSASNIGNFTGNYIEQDRVNQQLEVLNDLATVTLGIATKGAVGGAIAVAGITTKKIFQLISDVRRDVLEERDRSLLLQRSGNATLNGSRGTEN